MTHRTVLPRLRHLLVAWALVATAACHEDELVPGPDKTTADANVIADGKTNLDGGNIEIVETDTVEGSDVAPPQDIADVEDVPDIAPDITPDIEPDIAPDITPDIAPPEDVTADTAEPDTFVPACSDTAPCPPGQTCVQQDGVAACVPAFATACDPCNGDASCQHAGAPDAACVGFGTPAGSAGAFCANACATDADCPTGDVCADTVSLAGDAAKRCVPADGADCGCSDSAIAAGLSTACSVTADVDGSAATCTGSRSCTAAGLSLCDAATPTA
ncbi:MAG: hypothetical protein RIT45_2650, partial [Pseudomonadota bacterium]